MSNKNHTVWLPGPYGSRGVSNKNYTVFVTDPGGGFSENPDFEISEPLLVGTEFEFSDETWRITRVDEEKAQAWALSTTK